MGGPEVGLKGGRQLPDKALVVGALEVRGTAAGRVRLHVVPDASVRSLTGFVKHNVAPDTIVLTDGWGAYTPLMTMGYRHRPRTQGTPERAGKIAADAGVHVQKLELVAPDGSVDQRFTREVEVTAAQPSETRIPAAGTWITRHALRGSWRVAAYVDDASSPSVSSQFRLDRSAHDRVVSTRSIDSSTARWPRPMHCRSA